MNGPTRKVTDKKRSNESTESGLVLRSLSSDPTHNNQDLQLLILLTCLNPPTTSLYEAEWVSLFVSEPVLVDATMAVGMRHWSPQEAWQLQAEVRSSNALNSIIQRISCRDTYTDGFLAAIVTMAFEARLGHADSTWDVHADGLAQILRDRRARRIQEPEWFCDILAL